jgi:RNA polymerase sigma-70 factor (ECF subfamily)
MYATDSRPIPSGVKQHFPKMMRLAGHILGREDLAADAVQESLITLSALPELPQNLEAWLLRTVTHRSLASLRAHLRRVRNEQKAAELQAGSTASLDPERQLCHKELGEQIGRALLALPLEQRGAFLLREIEGLDYERISTAQGVPIGTVRSRLNRARRSLRHHMLRQPTAATG